MMVAMVQAREYLTIRCHNAFCCQSPQMAMTRLRNGFEAAIVCELVNRIPLQRSSRPTRMFREDLRYLAPKICDLYHNAMQADWSKLKGKNKRVL